jgi:hypothetical protein
MASWLKALFSRKARKARASKSIGNSKAALAGVILVGGAIYAGSTQMMRNPSNYNAETGTANIPSGKMNTAKNSDSQTTESPRIINESNRYGIPGAKVSATGETKMNPTDCVKNPKSPYCNSEKPCIINEGTKDVIAESEIYWSKFSQLQDGFNNSGSTCANTQVAKDIKKVFGIQARALEKCRDDHQNELRKLDNYKNLYYSRLNLLQKEPLCSNIVAAVSGIAANKIPISNKKIDDPGMDSGYSAMAVK